MLHLLVINTRRGYLLDQEAWMTTRATKRLLISLAVIPIFSFGAPVVLSTHFCQFKHTLPGRIVKIQKVYDPDNKTAGFVSDYDGIQSPADLVRMEVAENDFIVSRYGALDGAIIDKLNQMSDDDTMRVEVNVKQPKGIVYLSKFDHTMEELKANSLAAADAKPLKNLDAVFSSNGISRGETLSDFNGVVTLTKTQLLKLAFDSEVSHISEVREKYTTMSPWHIMLPSLFQTGPLTENAVTLARSAYSHSQSALPTNLANHVHAATFESGLHSALVSCLNVSPGVLSYWDPQPSPFHTPIGTTDPDDAFHSDVSFVNLVNAAPGANFYHRYSWSFNTSADANFIINNQINTVSSSTSNGSGPVNNPQNLAIDDFANRYPYPVFCTPTGNGGAPLVPNWIAYNQISVGNVQDSNVAHFSINDAGRCGVPSQTTNPSPRPAGYCIDGGTYPNCAGDREMPYIVAPGWAPHATIRGDCPLGTYYLSGTTPTTTPPIWMRASCVPLGSGLDTLTWGTSMSAPTMNGMAADLIGQVSILGTKPEGVRAIFLQTARNVTGGYWRSGTDGLDGAGVVHGQDAIAFAQTMTPININSTAVTKAFYYTSFSASDFIPSQIPRNFNIKIPSSITSGTHLRVVFTWDSSPDLITSQNLLSDFDLWVYTNSGGLLTSSSYDSNIETVDVPNSAITAGGTYTCSIRPWVWRMPPNARSPRTYAALTWGFVADHAH
jgi:hypothetical protein